MKQPIYTITHEHKSNHVMSAAGIAIREKSTGALNSFYRIALDGNNDDVCLLPMDLLMRVQELITVYGAKIEWNLTTLPVIPN